ncbi:MAG TPA: hypothetical protein VMZ24_05475 [Patescibacteria group bacterium]|nr:hypothetical protein [Patescibacteria group bacterium]
MLRVALKEYQSRIERLLEDNRLPAAAAHCHFLLQQYPRYIETYRLFGRALLEQKLYNDAIDVFCRVVSADPEDLMAHAGMAMAYREEQDLPKAIWHMERAFEIEPYNGAVQEELRDLGARGGSSKRLGDGLNRAALARLYFRGGLYPKAATELLFLLEKFPERMDLQLLLAETYYWEDRRLDAIAQCSHILAHSPYCIKANAILADLWLRGGRFSDAREHLNNLQSLTLLTATDVDPNTTVGRALSAHPDIKLPEKIVVDALDKVGPASIQFTYDTDWLLEIGVEGERGSDDFEQIKAVDVGIPQKGIQESSQDTTEENIDWLKEVIIAGDEPVSDLGEPLIEPATAGDHLPGGSAVALEDTILALDGSEIKHTNGQPSQSFEEQSDETGEFADDIPSWSELNAVEGQTKANKGIGLTEADWLDQIAPDSEIDDELPDWLDEAVGFTEELIMPSDYQMPDWLEEPADDSARKFDSSSGTKSSEYSQGSPLSAGETGEFNVKYVSSVPDGAGDDMALTGQDTSDKSKLPPSGWLVESDEEADSFSEVALDRTGDLGFEAASNSIPWLEDLAAEFEEQADQETSPSPDEPTTEDQTDDESV